MLTLEPISNPKEQRAFLRNFDPSEQTLLVSDLKSKLDLSRRLLKDRGFIPGDSVLRASELWKMLLVRLRPDLQLISKEFALTLISQKLGRLKLDWVQGPGVAQTSYDYLAQLMPVLAHENGPEFIREWFQNNQQSFVRWGRWFELSVQLWREFLQDGFVAPPWVCGVLVNEAELGQAWSKPLVVDLGAELNQVEADLLTLLSRSVDVMVLEPRPSWEAEYKKTLIAYELFEKNQPLEKKNLYSDKARATFRSGHAAVNERSELSAAQIEHRRYTTMIAEVKDAVAQIRMWLASSGSSLPQIDPYQVAIVAPDIEVYWPALSSYFETEGIPAQKDLVRRLHGFPDITRWLAHLRLRSGAFAEADVEVGLFDSSGQKPDLISYERFRMLYGILYEREDMEREKKVADHFSVQIDLNEETERDRFVEWSLLQLPKEVEIQRIETLFRRLFSECPESTRFQIGKWITYLEQLAAKIECRIREGEASGVACLNLSSAESSPATHMMVLGLTESALKQTGGTAILFSDILSLRAQFGFQLASEDQNKREFEARWLTEDPDRSLVLCVAETDFAGGVQASSWFWIRGAALQNKTKHDREQITLPAPTRWDEIQRASLATIARERGWTDTHSRFLEEQLQCDLDLASPALFGGDKILHLSPSGIEDYLNCPFIFAAKRIFRLTDSAELDLEVDPSRRGSLMHKLLELLTMEPMSFALSNEELAALVEKAKVESKTEFADHRLWPPLKNSFVQLSKRFLSLEKANRAQFPETHTVGREFAISGFVSAETGALSATQETGSLPFVGRIDRIDQDASGRLMIMDYKSSKGSISQFGSWLKNNKIQLLLYAHAVEQGLTNLKPRPVLAALYYVMRPLSRDTGFKVENEEQALFETTNRRVRNRLSMSEKQKLFNDGQQLVQTAVREMLTGNFKPNPRDRKLCVDCQWSAVCRAPHLNT